MKRYALFLFLVSAPGFCQSNTGELRLTVNDPSGRAVRTEVQLVSDANQYRSTFTTDAQGSVDARRLPYGIYQVQIQAPSFGQFSDSVVIRSTLPVDRTIQLKVAPVSQSVTVHESDTLLDPYRAGALNEMGQQTIQNRLTSIPGRTVQDLVNTEPGWLYEGNAVLHPRGSEYQTQFVINGIPLTDNRSPGFGPSIEANNIQSMSIYTAGIPAQYGRSLGGVVVVNTIQNEQPGFHGEFTLLGGSYATGGIETQDEYTWGKNTVGFSGAGNMTDHYLNTPSPENYTNNGTTGEFSLNYERQFTPKDHLTMIASHELARYAIPNELVQQNGAYVPNGDNTDGCSGPDPASDNCVYIPGGQLQTNDNFETIGILSYEHIFSPDTMVAMRGMARDNSLDFYSNPASWPVNVTQRNDFKDIYFNASITADRRHQEWKAGVQTDNKFLHENLSYVIPDCDDPSNPQCPFNVGIIDVAATSFAFSGSRPDLEQAAYVEDSLHRGNWSIDAGLRWDHYQLTVNKNAVSPRVQSRAIFPLLEFRFTARGIMFSKHPPSKIFSCRVLRRHRHSIPAFPLCNCRLSLRMETTMNWAQQRHCSASYVWTRICTGAMLKTMPTTRRSSVQGLAFGSNSTRRSFMALKRSLRSRMGAVLRIRQLLLYGGERLEPGHGRPFPRWRRH